MHIHSLLGELIDVISNNKSVCFAQETGIEACLQDSLHSLRDITVLFQQDLDHVLLIFNVTTSLVIAALGGHNSVDVSTHLNELLDTPGVQGAFFTAN